jgi:hypothetical protein
MLNSSKSWALRLRLDARLDSWLSLLTWSVEQTFLGSDRMLWKARQPVLPHGTFNKCQKQNLISTDF